MTTQVTFLLFEDDSNENEELSLLHTSFVSAHYFRHNQRVFIYCPDQQVSHRIDELLWSFEPDSFVPHNLAGEGPKSGSAVEISWQAPSNRRPILINLTSTVPHFAHQYSQIIDFVPSDDTLKQEARERFKSYRQKGFEVVTQPANSVQTSNDS